MSSLLRDTVSEYTPSWKIIEYFKGRCIICNATAVVVHEIEPRARGKKSMRDENRVPLCRDCHDWAHNIGAKASKDALVFGRENRLKMIYGENVPVLE